MHTPVIFRLLSVETETNVSIKEYLEMPYHQEVDPVTSEMEELSSTFMFCP